MKQSPEWWEIVTPILERLIKGLKLNDEDAANIVGLERRQVQHFRNKRNIPAPHAALYPWHKKSTGNKGKPSA